MHPLALIDEFFLSLVTRFYSYSVKIPKAIFRIISTVFTTLFIVVHKEEEEEDVVTTACRVNGFNILPSTTSSFFTSIDTIFFVFILTAKCILIKPLLFFHLSLIHSLLFVTFIPSRINCYCYNVYFFWIHLWIQFYLYPYYPPLPHCCIIWYFFQLLYVRWHRFQKSFQLPVW